MVFAPTPDRVGCQEGRRIFSSFLPAISSIVIMLLMTMTLHADY